MNNLKNNIIRKGKGKNFDFGFIFTFDTEAFRYDQDDKEIQKMAIWDIYDGENHYEGFDSDSLINKIESLANETLKCSFFAHNIKYDLQISGLWKKIILNQVEGFYLSKAMIDTSLFLQLKSNNDKITINFIDSMNYFKSSLRDLAQSFGIEKALSVEEYKLDTESWNKLLKDKMKEIVRVDTEILYKIMDQFIKDNTIIKGLTAPSTALKTFKKYYLEKTITFPKDLIQYALASYRGGLVFPFKLLRGEYVYDYDINSLYPFSMFNNYSIRYKGKVDSRIQDDDIRHEKLNYLLNVDFFGKNNVIVPVRAIDKRLVFLNNAKDVWITGQEYLALKENGFDIIVNKGYAFYSYPIFKNYINHFYNLKKNSKGGKKLFYKLMLNSLYGKFGENRKHSEIILLNEKEKLEKYGIDEITIQFMKEMCDNEGKGKLFDFETIKVHYYRDFLVIKKETEARYSPLIASEVTANARLYNFKLRQELKTVYYTDTDSFFIPFQIQESDELGGLKKEFQGKTWLYSPKDYFFIDDSGRLHLKLKGVQTENAYKKFIQLGYIDNDHYVLDMSLFNDKINIYIYEDNKFSGLKRAVEENVVIDFDEKEIKRIPLKMKYIGNQGYPFEDMEDYISYKERILNSVQSYEIYEFL